MRAKVVFKKSIIVTAVAAVGLVAFILWFSHHRIAAERITCLKTLAQINGAKGQWALEHSAASDAVPTWDDIAAYGGRQVSPDWGLHYPPRCPSGGLYSIGKVADVPTCSFSNHVLTREVQEDMALHPERW